MKVLVVEDDPNLRALWGAVFHRVGHEAVLTETEAEASQALGASGFDLVLLDLYLGSNETIDVERFARALRPDTKIAVITGTAAYQRGELFAASPTVAAVLRKPVDIEDLVAVCEHLDGEPAAPPPQVSASATIQFRT